MAKKPKSTTKSITTNGVKLKETPYTITSTELHTHINKLRVYAGENEIRRNDFVARVVDELSDDENFHYENFVVEKLANGMETKVYTLTEEQSILVGMRESKAVRRNVLKKLKELSAAHNKAFANPPRAGILQDKRSAHHPMMDALIDLRQSLGKETTTVHFMSENKLCNGVVTGNFKSAKEDTLSNEEAMLLAEVRRLNQSMLQMDMGYDERKKKLVAFATKRRTKLLSQ